MVDAQCVSCGKSFKEIKKKQTIKVTLSNPGDVFCSGDVISCPNCNEQYVEGKDILALAESFDQAHKEKYAAHKVKTVPM